MAFVHGIGTNLNGSAGQWTYYERMGKTIAKQKNGPNKSDTKKQRDQRVQIAAPCNVWRTFDKTLKPSFEDEKRKPGQSNFSAFVSRAMRAFKVFLPKDLAEFRCSVAAPYMISEGSLQEITTEEIDGQLVTNLCLGDEPITGDTTVHELFSRLFNNNGYESRFLLGDQLQFYRMKQTTSAHNETILPYVHTYAKRVQFDTRNFTRLAETVGTDGFQCTQKADGKYYLSAPIQEGTLIAWMQSRLLLDGRTLVSTQWLKGTNPLLSQYTSPSALYLAAKSYGPVKPEDYVTPGSTSERDIIEQLILEAEQEHEDSTGGSGSTGGGTTGGTTGGGPGTVHEVTVTCTVVGGHGQVTPASHTVTFGSNITFTAAPDEGYRPDWPNGSHDLTYTLQARESTNITLTFSPKTSGGNQNEDNDFGSRSRKRSKK